MSRIIGRGHARASDATAVRVQPCPLRRKQRQEALLQMNTRTLTIAAAIGALLANGNCDDLLISRLKKRKLQLKDEIAAVG